MVVEFIMMDDYRPQGESHWDKIVSPIRVRNSNGQHRCGVKRTPFSVQQISKRGRKAERCASMMESDWIVMVAPFCGGTYDGRTLHYRSGGGDRSEVQQ